MRITRRCRRCAARAVVAVDARADTDANCASHRVLQHFDKSLAVDNAMRVAQASVLLAQFGVSFDPFGGAKSRVTVSAYSAPRLAEARQRPARAALGACCHRCVGGAHVLDDRFGRRRRCACWRRSPARRSAQRCAQATLQDVVDARILDARTLVDPIVALLAANRGAVAPELEKERDARVAGALHTLTLLAGMPDIMLPTQRLQLLTMVCTHGAKFDRAESQARLSALFSSLATFYDSYAHPRVSDADVGAAIDQCLAVAQAADAHWRYRMLASVVLMMYALPRAGAIASEQSARVVAHFASSAVGPLRQVRVIGRLATAWLLLHFKRHLTTGAELVSLSDDEVRAYADRHERRQRRVGALL
jgi:hypothetical protein